MTEPKRDWRKIKYYPVSMEKLERASMKEVAYLIAPMNIGEDCEYFDKVKKFLIIPEPRKSLDEISQELDEKFEKLIEQYKRNSYASKLTYEELYGKKEEPKPQPTTEELQEVLDKIAKELKENSKELDGECKKVLYDNLWDLYEDYQK